MLKLQTGRYLLLPLVLLSCKDKDSFPTTSKQSGTEPAPINSGNKPEDRPTPLGACHVSQNAPAEKDLTVTLFNQGTSKLLQVSTRIYGYTDGKEVARKDVIFSGALGPDQDSTKSIKPISGGLWECDVIRGVDQSGKTFRYAQNIFGNSEKRPLGGRKKAAAAPAKASWTGKHGKSSVFELRNLTDQTITIRRAVVFYLGENREVLKKYIANLSVKLDPGENKEAEFGIRIADLPPTMKTIQIRISEVDMEKLEEKWVNRDLETTPN